MGYLLPFSIEIEHIHVRAAKIIHRLSDNVTDQEALVLTRWEPVNSIYKRKLLTLMYKIHRSEVPDNIVSLFNINIGRYNLRNNIKFSLPRFNLEVGRTSLRYRGPLSWNSITDTIKQAQSLNTFKLLLKKNRALLNDISFHKEACFVPHKDPEYIYYYNLLFYLFYIAVKTLGCYPVKITHRAPSVA